MQEERTISGFSRGVNEAFGLLGCYAAQLGRFYRRFGALENGTGRSETLTLKMGPTACPETSVTVTLRCVTSQKSEYLICTATEACNNAKVIDIDVNNRYGTAARAMTSRLSLQRPGFDPRPV